MNKSLLVTRPNFDLTTRYISAWAEKIVELAKSKKKDVFDLSKERANRKEFESMVRKHNPDLVFLNGHGNETQVAGQNNEILLSLESSRNLFKDMTIYALSCKSGKMLGPGSVDSGAQSYIGYAEDFIFLYDEKRINRPKEDKTAEIFLEPSNQIMISLLKNHTAREAHENSKQAFAKRIRKMLSSQTSPIESSAVRYLIWNMNCQVCYDKIEK